LNALIVNVKLLYRVYIIIKKVKDAYI